MPGFASSHLYNVCTVYASHDLKDVTLYSFSYLVQICLMGKIDAKQNRAMQTASKPFYEDFSFCCFAEVCHSAH